MSDRTIYALNTVSGVVSKLDPDLLTHPVIGKNYVEVENPDSCIECGVQPREVTTADGEEVTLADIKPEASAPKAKKPTKEEK